MFKHVHRHAAKQLGTTSPRNAILRQKRYLHAPVAFDWKDPLGAANLYTEDELAIAETAESYCQERMLPRVLGMYLLVLYELPLVHAIVD
jgi:glutaryl-CoA dehydrogenase